MVVVVRLVIAVVAVVVAVAVVNAGLLVQERVETRNFGLVGVDLAVVELPQGWKT